MRKVKTRVCIFSNLYLLDKYPFIHAIWNDLKLGPDRLESTI